MQRAPDLLLSIKASVDQDRRPGRFILTGSANVLTLPRVADSLAGRMSLHHLWPLSQGELSGRPASLIDQLFSGESFRICGAEDLEVRVVRGDYPEVIARSERRRAA